MIRLFFGDTEVSNNQNLSFAKSQEEISFSWDYDPEKYYVIILYQMLDVDDNYSPYINYLVTEIPGTDLRKGQEYFDYIAPNLLDDSKPHRYVMELYEHTDDIIIQRDRHSANLDFLDNLNFIDKLTFTVKHKKTVSFRLDTKLSSKDRKYCSAVLKIAAKQSADCLQKRNWGSETEGSRCYNPRSVAHSSVKGESGRIDCGAAYDFENMTNEYLQSYAYLNKIPLPKPYSRDKLLDAIYNYKIKKNVL